MSWHIELLEIALRALSHECADLFPALELQCKMHSPAGLALETIRANRSIIWLTDHAYLTISYPGDYLQITLPAVFYSRHFAAQSDALASRLSTVRKVVFT